MWPQSQASTTKFEPELRLPAALMMRYLFFLSRRPISASNRHYLRQRLGGLQSLCGMLEQSNLRPLRMAIQQLRGATPANFSRLVEQIQFTLVPLMAPLSEIPPDVVVSNNGPPSELFTSARRVLLVLGPAIGIGDEAIMFSLPVWLKAVNPQMEITVLSAYRDLWEQHEQVDGVLHYTNYDSLVAALRGQPPYDGFDLVVMSDFERPDLYQAMCYERSAPRYVEISLGGQTVFAVDQEARWLHRAQRPLPYFSNYYHGLVYLARWLGLPAQASDKPIAPVRRSMLPSADHVRIYVNPFTSKYDPSELYWSRLLSDCFPETPERPIEVLIDPGPNVATERFAEMLVRSAAARTPAGVTFGVGWQPGARPRTLENVFANLQQAHVVVCSDSFTAHVAPLYGCTTLVIAAAGLEKWRVPYASNYYFSSDAPLSAIASSIRQVLQQVDPAVVPGAPTPTITSTEQHLDTLSRSFARLLSDSPANDFETLYRTYQELARTYQDVANRLPEWPDGFSSLLADCTYQELLKPLDQGDLPPSQLRSDLAMHFQEHWQQWQTTNLRKYLDAALSERTS